LSSRRVSLSTCSTGNRGRRTRPGQENIFSLVILRPKNSMQYPRKRKPGYTARPESLRNRHGKRNLYKRGRISCPLLPALLPLTNTRRDQGHGHETTPLAANVEAEISRSTQEFALWNPGRSPKSRLWVWRSSVCSLSSTSPLLQTCGTVWVMATGWRPASSFGRPKTYSSPQQCPLPYQGKWALFLEFLHFDHAAAALVRLRSVRVRSSGANSSGCSTISWRSSVIRSRQDGRFAFRLHRGNGA